MRFLIVGARGDTGEDVQTIIDVPARTDAEAWATEQGILWTSITAQPPVIPMPVAAVAAAPQFAPPSFDREYRAERDPIIYVIGAVAVIAAMLAMNPRIGDLDARAAGRLVGSAVGAFVMIFLIGLVGAKIAGKAPVRGRIGFFAAALLAVVGLFIGEARLGNSGATAGAGLALRRTLTPDDPDVVAADSKILLAESRKFADEATARGEAYQKRLNLLVGDGLIHVSRMDTAPKIAESRRKLLLLRQLVQEREKEVIAVADSFPARVNALPISEPMKRGAIQGYRKNIGKSLAITRESTRIGEETVAEGLKLADFLESRLGTFQVSGNSALFQTVEDVKVFNQIAGRIDALVAKEQALIAQQQQLSRDGNQALQDL